MARIENQKTVPVILIAVALLLVGARIASRAIPSDAPRQSTSGVHWVALADAENVSRRTGKPILYDFTAEWCQPCHMLDEAVFQNPDLVARINEHFVPVRVVDRQREEGRNTPDVLKAQARFGVGAFPTVVFADANGNARAQIVGFRGAEEFENAMERAR